MTFEKEHVLTQTHLPFRERRKAVNYGQDFKEDLCIVTMHFPETHLWPLIKEYRVHKIFI